MPTHYQGPPDRVSALDAYIKLMRAAESVTARLEPVMGAAGLTVCQFGALEALLHLGPLCQRDLGRKLLRSSANVTVVVTNLARRGLVHRVRRRDDRRFITVSLTDEGRQLISGLFPRHVDLVVHEMSSLSRLEQQELGRLCRLVGHGGRRQDGGKENGNGAARDAVRLPSAL
jgi:MarR family transcriptional regulator, 2-MHQ and catechol-resistance regulon repressor